MLNTHETLILEALEGDIVVVRLNRPDAANALSTDMAMDIHHAFMQLGASGSRAVILTGMGRNFCAGADLKERRGMTETQWQRQHDALEEAHRAVLNCPVPVIAAVHGAAFGGGLELAMACDFIYAADSARFALTETTLGIMPGMGGTQLLPRSIGAARARELIYMGKAFSAAEAHQWGLVNRLLPEAGLLESAIACARTIAGNAPLAVRAAKAAISEGQPAPLHEALQIELTHYNSLLATKDRQEGINAFNEKRKPSFTGE
ncbi:MAG: enoyl-CoA hydratase [Proteobacteria bacterium]|nr:enoyl-CoA hydratase [Pseudomonadota bacterium]